MLNIKVKDNVSKNDLSLIKLFRQIVNLGMFYDIESFYSSIASGDFKHHKIYKNKNTIEVKRISDNELIFVVIE